MGTELLRDQAGQKLPSTALRVTLTFWSRVRDSGREKQMGNKAEQLGSVRSHVGNAKCRAGGRQT